MNGITPLPLIIMLYTQAQAFLNNQASLSESDNRMDHIALEFCDRLQRSAAAYQNLMQDLTARIFGKERRTNENRDMGQKRMVPGTNTRGLASPFADMKETIGVRTPMLRSRDTELRRLNARARMLRKASVKYLTEQH